MCIILERTESNYLTPTNTVRDRIVRGRLALPLTIRL
jgi:hypothetical protein